MEILRRYERASGQQINQDKTTIFFSASTSLVVQKDIQEALHLPVIKQYETYLGLPSLVGRSKSTSFVQLKERLWRKVQGWKERLFHSGKKRGVDKSSTTGHPNLYHALF
jgi:hypothetical protein